MIYSFSLPYMRDGKKRNEAAREIGYKTIDVFEGVEATYYKATSMMTPIESLTLMGMLHSQKWRME